MALPEAIQRQEAEAEALFKQAYGPADASEDSDTDTTEQSGVEQTTDVEPETQPQQPTELKAKPGREDDADYWRQRAQTINGMLQHQAGEMQQLRAHVQALTTQLEGIKTSQTPQAAKAERVEKDTDTETFGEEYIAMTDRRAEAKARAAVANEVAAMREYIQRLEAKIGSVETRMGDTSQQRFYEQLERRVPDYEALDMDEGFLSWLEEADPVYGVTRQIALNHAASQLDVDRVASIFNAYKGTVRQPEPTKPVVSQQARQELERQVSPRSQRAASSAPVAAKTFTGKDYEYAYSQRAVRDLGPQRVAELQAEVDAAVAEGRVQW